MNGTHTKPGHSIFDPPKDAGISDFEIVSSDGESFHVHTLQLRTNASTFFDMLELPKGDNEATVKVSETVNDLNIILPYCYNIPSPSLGDLSTNQLLNCFSSANKYGIQRAIELLGAELTGRVSPSTTPKTAFALYRIGTIFSYDQLCHVTKKMAATYGPFKENHLAFIDQLGIQGVRELYSLVALKLEEEKIKKMDAYRESQEKIRLLSSELEELKSAARNLLNKLPDESGGGNRLLRIKKTSGRMYDRERARLSTLLGDEDSDDEPKIQCPQQ